MPASTFVTGSAAACLAVTFTNPFEVLKVRQQLVLTDQQLSIRHLLTSGKTVWQNIGQLQRALVPWAYVYQTVLNGTRMSLYRTFVGDGSSVGARVAFGALAGGVAAFLASPLNLIKTCVQSHREPHDGSAHIRQAPVVAEYARSLPTVRYICRTSSIFGFFKGAHAAALRTSIGSAVQLSSYDTIKERLGSPALAALSSGILVALAQNPPDVVCTRLYQQRQHQSSRAYAGVVDCVRKVWRQEGWRAFFKGILPHYVRIGPHTAIFFLAMEAINKNP